MQHDGDGRILEDGEERRKVLECDRVDHGDRPVGRDLHDAQLRAIRALPHELRVDRETAGRADRVHQIRELGGGGEKGGMGSSHGAPR